MKEIVVISGKGGTGKTSLTAAFAMLGGSDLVVADCDVDAADMHLLLEPDFAHAEDFIGGQLAVIDQGRCSGCNLCGDVCRFDAVEMIDGRPQIDEFRCEGCGYCARVCPAGAVFIVDRTIGEWFRSRTRAGSTMVHAQLAGGAGNSGKLVAQVKGEARATADRNNRQLVLVDGAPGVGCPVISSLSGASLVLLVTEPTVAALHDLRRVHELVKRWGIREGCVINKADLDPVQRESLLRYLAEDGIPLLTEIPYDERFTAATTKGRTIVEWDEELGRSIAECWTKIVRLAADV